MAFNMLRCLKLRKPKIFTNENSAYYFPYKHMYYLTMVE